MKSLPTRCPGRWEKTKGSWFNSGAARHNIKCKSWKNNNCWRRNKYVYAISVGLIINDMYLQHPTGTSHAVHHWSIVFVPRRKRMEIKHGGYAAVVFGSEGKKPKSKKKIIVFDQLTVKSYQSGTNNSLNNTYFEKKQVTCMTPTKAPAASCPRQYLGRAWDACLPYKIPKHSYE